jgi:hypothetical protein
MNKMTWLDLYNFLHEQANAIKNVGKFPWQEEVQVFDFGTLEYYSTDFIQMPDKKISFSVDTTQVETTNGF